MVAQFEAFVGPRRRWVVDERLDACCTPGVSPARRFCGQAGRDLRRASGPTVAATSPDRPWELTVESVASSSNEPGDPRADVQVLLR